MTEVTDAMLAAGKAAMGDSLRQDATFSVSEMIERIYLAMNEAAPTPNVESSPSAVERRDAARKTTMRRMHLHDDGGDRALAFDAGWDAAIEALSPTADKRVEELCAKVEADAVSGLRYIEQRYGRLEGVGWDRVFDAHDELFALAALRGDSQSTKGGGE